MRVVITLSLVVLFLGACTKEITFKNTGNEYTELGPNEFLDQIEAQTPPANFSQTSYRAPQKATFHYTGHLRAETPMDVTLHKDGKKYTGFYVIGGDTTQLRGQPQDSTLWNSKIELYEQQSDGTNEEMSFITDPLDEYQSIYFEMVGTYGKSGRKPEEGKAFYLYRRDFSLPVYALSQVSDTVVSPYKMLKSIKESEDAYSLRQKLIEHNLILSRADLLVLEIDREQYTTFQPDTAFEMELIPKNLFGDNRKEIVVRVSYGKRLFFYTFFYKSATIWKQVPSLIRVSRDSYSQSPCIELEGYSEDDFWLPEWIDLRKSGEKCLVGRSLTGYCGDGIDRGAEIHFNIWAISPAEVRLVFSAREFRYWYASPSPAPIGRVIKREFDYTENFPKVLKIKDYVQQSEFDSSGDFVKLKLTESFQTYVPIFD